MARGYRISKPSKENYGEDIDRLFYGDHKVTIFDNPDYEQARTGWQELEHFGNNRRRTNKCGCGTNKDAEFWRNAFLILLVALVLRMLLDGMRGAVGK